MSALLEVEELRVEFQEDDGLARAVDGVSYSVDAGEALAIVGGPGCGKTVGLLALLGLIGDESARISGRVAFGGRDLLQLTGDELRSIRGNEIAIVSHEPLASLHPFYKVGTQLIEAILAHRGVSKAAARDRAIDLLEVVGIADAHRRVDEYPEQFSRSTRQLAMLATALANEPKLLIADEPAGALDVAARAHVLQLLRRLRTRLGMALIVVTRDPAVAAEAADEICVMYAGRVVERASAQVILSSPQHPYTWELLRSVPGLGNAVDEQPVPIPGRPSSLIHRPSGCLFHPRCPYAREEHRRIDPALRPVPGGHRHEVACLLEPELRTSIWRGLRTARAPAPLHSSSST